MDAVERLKRRRHRRQEAFRTLDEIEDLAGNLLQSLQVIAGRVQELKDHHFFFIFHPTSKGQLLADLSEQTTKAALLVEITNRVKAIRGEFSALKVSDDRELAELGAILQPTTTAR